MARLRCFIISPIGAPDSEIRKHADNVYRGIIEPALDELRNGGIEIEALRSDHLREPGKVSEQMFREIFSDDICIVLLTFFNPNVFYELAVAQCAYRPVVALLRKGDALPFDVADLRTIPYDLEDACRLIDKLDAKELAENLKTMLSGQWQPTDPFGEYAPSAWLACRDPRAWQRMIETAKPAPLSPGIDSVWSHPHIPDKQIFIRTGGIRYVDSIDVIVSSENTDLQLARYYDPSISGALRYLDSERGLDGRVIRDALDEQLKNLIKQHDIHLPVMPGTVLTLPTTGLASKGVKYVFLAATVRGDGPGAGYSTVVQGEIESCIRACFQYFTSLSKEQLLESIIFPVFGAGTAKQDPVQVAELLLRVMVESMTEAPPCKRVYVLAWIESHRMALRKAAMNLGLECEHKEP